MILKSPDADAVQIRLDAVCHDCRHRHRIAVTPDGFTAELWQWHTKHPGHRFEFLTPRRDIPGRFDDRMFEQAGVAPWWLEYKHNADLKLGYASSVAITITLAPAGVGLASSTTWVAGRESTAISNTTNNYVDYRVAGKITTGTSPTNNTEIRIYGYAAHNDTPDYPDVFDGVDSAETVTNTQILDQLPRLGASLVSSGSNVAYPFTQLLTIAEAYGFVPKNWGIFVAHNTAVALNGTESNHELDYTGAYFTSI
jgi:hypothetical protein